MNYIINPSWFYWISVVDGIKSAVFAFLVSAFVVDFVFILLFLVHKNAGFGFGEHDSDNIAAKALIKPIKIASIALFVLIVFSILIPTKNTLIEMMIAKQATYENAQWTLETLKSAVDYIVNAIKSVK